MEFLLEGLLGITWKTVVMWALGALLIYLAIRKEMEPTLLLPIGFGAILVNIRWGWLVYAFIYVVEVSHGIMI